MAIIKQTMSNEDAKVEDSTLVYDGFCKIEVRKVSQRCFDDSWMPVHTREVMVKCSAVGVIPYDPVLDKVVLIEQFRPATLGKAKTPWLIEVVAGIVDREETSEELVCREMKEETGLEVEDMIFAYEYFTAPGYSTEKVKLYCAKIDSTKTKKFCGLKDEHEDIKTHVISTKDAFAALHAGEINNGFTIIALQWLELNLERVRSQYITKGSEPNI